MSVLIKMEMPTSCCYCVLAYKDQDSDHNCEWWCAPLCESITKRSFIPNETKLDNCPLVPVPPHGRLIDADANIETLKKCEATPEGEIAKICYEYAIKVIGACPTIIPAEEGEA